MIDLSIILRLKIKATGSIYALIAIGFAVIYRTVKFFHLAHGVVYTIGAYLTYSLLILLGINSLISFLVSIAFAALVGIAIDRFVYYPLCKQNASNLIFLVASFGVFIFISSLLALNMGVSPCIGLLIGACVAAISGGYPAVRLKGDYLALVTFGLGVIVYAIAKNWVSLTRGTMGLPGIPGFSIFGYQLSGIGFYLILVLVFCNNHHLYCFPWCFCLYPCTHKLPVSVFGFCPSTAKL